MKPSNLTHQVIISEPVLLPSGLDPDISYLHKPNLWKDPQQLRDLIRDVDGLIVRNQTQVDQALLARAGKLKVIGRLGIGLDNIDLKAARDAGVQVVYAPGSNSVSVAEYCLTQILNIIRKIPQAMSATSSGKWQRGEFTGRELSEVAVGLIGFGNTARELAVRLEQLGGKVIVFTRSPDKVPPHYPAVQLNSLLERADIISLHVPGGSDTRHLLGQPQFQRMQPSAWLINTSRGTVVDETALYYALKKGQIAGAVVDVRETEPPAIGKLEQLTNFYATPHIAAFTEAAQSRVCQRVLNDVAAVLKDEQPAGLIPDGV